MIINEVILSKILCGVEFHSKLQILNWDIKDDVSVIKNNFMYKMSRLTVEYKKKNKIFRKYFCLKIPPMINYRLAFFEYEYLVYTTVLEAMYKIDGEYIGPRFYYADENHSIILKDLSQSGYRKINRIEQLDFDQCYLIFKCLAKFHALSVKLDRTVGIDSNLKDCAWMIKLMEMDESIGELIMYSYDQFLENLDPDLNQNYRNKLIRMRDTILKAAIEEVKPGKFKFHVLNHGECWTANVLFKFNKYGIVQKAKLTDFHGTYWTTPAFDILRFTISSMKFEVYEKQFDLLLEIYLSTLNQMLGFLKCGRFELADLKKDLDNMNNFSVLLISSFLPRCVSSFEDPMDMRNVIVNGVGQCNLSALNKYFKNEVFLSMSKKWFLHFANKGIFD